MNTTDISLRIFQAHDFTLGADGEVCWYFEPADYDGDVLFSMAYATRSEARAAGLRYAAGHATEVDTALEEAAAAAAYYEAEAEGLAAVEAEAGAARV